MSTSRFWPASTSSTGLGGTAATHHIMHYRPLSDDGITKIGDELRVAGDEVAW
jgi:hypothetical protein